METKTWITADLHFGHANIIFKFCPESRGRFKDTEDMEWQMIKEWNDQVGPLDKVYILGDVAFTNATKAAGILHRLNGVKILIEGNHDHKNLKDPVFRDCFAEVHKYLTITHNGTMVVMFHYPIFEWDQMHRGSVHFYGHVHGKSMGLEKYRARDVAFDATRRVVSNMDDMVADALRGEIRAHH